MSVIIGACGLMRKEIIDFGIKLGENTFVVDKRKINLLSAKDRLKFNELIWLRLQGNKLDSQIKDLTIYYNMDEELHIFWGLYDLSICGFQKFLNKFYLFDAPKGKSNLMKILEEIK